MKTLGQHPKAGPSRPALLAADEPNKGARGDAVRRLEATSVASGVSMPTFHSKKATTLPCVRVSCGRRDSRSQPDIQSGAPLAFVRVSVLQATHYICTTKHEHCFCSALPAQFVRARHGMLLWSVFSCAAAGLSTMPLLQIQSASSLLVQTVQSRAITSTAGDTANTHLRCSDAPAVQPEPADNDLAMRSRGQNWRLF